MIRVVPAELAQQVVVPEDRPDTIERIVLDAIPPTADDVGERVADDAVGRQGGQVVERIVQRQATERGVEAVHPAGAADLGVELVGGHRRADVLGVGRDTGIVGKRSDGAVVGTQHPAAHQRRGGTDRYGEAQHHPPVGQRSQVQRAARRIVGGDGVGDDGAATERGRHRPHHVHARIAWRAGVVWRGWLTGFVAERQSHHGLVALAHHERVDVDRHQQALLAHQQRVPVVEVGGCCTELRQGDEPGARRRLQQIVVRQVAHGWSPIARTASWYRTANTAVLSVATKSS